MMAVLSDLLRRADDPGETLETLATRTAGAQPPACRRGERADGAARG
jgi:hypothetical protein